MVDLTLISISNKTSGLNQLVDPNQSAIKWFTVFALETKMLRVIKHLSENHEICLGRIWAPADLEVGEFGPKYITVGVFQ